MSATLYERVMGDAFYQLPAAVQAFHRLTGNVTLHGEVSTAPASSWAARLLGRCLGTPRTATNGAIRFELKAQAEQEQWTRHFPAQLMSSVLRQDAGHVQEQLGASTLNFTLEVDAEGRLSMRLVRLRFLGLPCPRWLMPRVRAVESGDWNELFFDVSADVPLFGTVAHYFGYLKLPSQEVQ